MPTERFGLDRICVSWTILASFCEFNALALLEVVASALFLVSRTRHGRYPCRLSPPLDVNFCWGRGTFAVKFGVEEDKSDGPKSGYFMLVLLFWPAPVAIGMRVVLIRECPI
jgi:hypothetical protein